MNQAAILLTHIEIPPIYEHFRRLQRETQGILDVFLAVNDAAPFQPATDSLPAHFRTTEQDAARVLPNRHREKIERGGRIIPGFTDLAYMPALLTPPLTAYEHIWVVEYDVDYAGNWESFFMPLMQSQADLMGTTFFPRDQCSGWVHWSGFETPSPSQHHFRSFLPIVRFSRRMLDCYAEAMRFGDWRGHSEAIYPAIASSNGLLIEDLGGFGPLTPLAARGRIYVNSPSPDGGLSPGTVVHRPVKHETYFHETPEQFVELGFLHHPVKPQDRGRSPEQTG